MKAASLIKEVWENCEFDYEQRETLKKGIAIRGSAVGDEIMRTFARPQLEALLPSLELIDKFPRGDRTPAVIDFRSVENCRLTTRSRFLNGQRVLMLTEVPHELRSGVFDFELVLKIGLASVRTDQFYEDDNQPALQNRLIWDGEPAGFRMDSAVTAEAIRAEIKKRLAAVVKEATSAVAA